MGLRFLKMLKKNEGTTLPELMIALVITALMLTGMAGMVGIAVQVKATATEQNLDDRELRHLYIYFQKQIRQSEKLYITSQGLCLEDMESRHLGYVNYYTYDEKTRVLYRHKMTKAGVPQGAKMQLAAGIRYFSMHWDSERACVQFQVVTDHGKGFKATVAFTEHMEVIPV